MANFKLKKPNETHKPMLKSTPVFKDRGGDICICYNLCNY